MSNRHRLHGAVALVCGITAAVIACDKKSPTSPQAAGDGFVSLRLTAPERITPGESVQLTAEAVRADGSAENVSSQASWVSSNALVLQLTTSGLATAGARGESNVQVRHASRIAQAYVLVVPPNTFRLGGIIKESGVGISGVLVRIVAGIGEGLRTFSDPSGEYSLFGARGPVRIQLTKAGYADSLQDVDVSAHRRQDFELALERPRADYRGTYTLRIAAERGCIGISPETFPEAAKRREYTADVAQDGPRVTVTLSGADFVLTSGRGNSFAGLIDSSNTLRFIISNPNFDFYGPWYYGLPDVAEKVDDTILIVSGEVAVREAPRLTGKLNGYLLAAARSSYAFGPPYRSVCNGSHDFEMVRR